MLMVHIHIALDYKYALALINFEHATKNNCVNKVY